MAPGTPLPDRLHLKYVIPCFRFAFVSVCRLDPQQLGLKKLLIDFLKGVKDKKQLALKIVNTTTTVIGFQRMVKTYFKKKRQWEATLKVVLEDERVSMKRFLANVLGAARQKYDWLLTDLDELQGEHL